MNQCGTAPSSITKQFEISGHPNKGNKLLDLNNLLDLFQPEVNKSFREFLKAHVKQQQSDSELNGYTIDVANVPIANFRLQLLAKYPSRNEDNSFFSYDPKELADFGEELKKRFMEELKLYMNLQEQRMNEILEARLLENEGLVSISNILKAFQDAMEERLKGSIFRNDEDVLKVFDYLKSIALSSFNVKGERKDSAREKDEGRHVELLSVLESEIDKRKPCPEEMWKARAAETIEVIRDNHRDYLDLAKEDNLDKAHDSFRKFAFIELKEKSPFPSNSEWHKKLEERVRSEIEAVLKEVKDLRREALSNKLPANTSHLPSSGNLKEEKSSPVKGFEPSRVWEGLLSDFITRNLASTATESPDENLVDESREEPDPVDGSQQDTNEVREMKDCIITRGYPHTFIYHDCIIETVQEKTGSGSTESEVRVELETRDAGDEEESDILFLEPQDIGKSSLPLTPREFDLENESSPPDEPEAPPMRETRSSRKREADSREGKGPQPKRSKDANGLPQLQDHSTETESRPETSEQKPQPQPFVNGNQCQDCCNFPPKGYPANSPPTRVEEHRVRYHLENFFPEPEHKEPFLDDLQYKMVLYHLLFKNVATKAGRKENGSIIWQCTLCPQESCTIHDAIEIKVHAIKIHFPYLSERLKQLQNDADLKKNLEQFENEGELCACGVYMTKGLTARYDHKRLCKLLKPSSSSASEEVEQTDTRGKSEAELKELRDKLMAIRDFVLPHYISSAYGGGAGSY